MNKSYRSIYNEQTGTWVAVSEITKAQGKRSKSGAVAASALVMGGLLNSGAVMAAATSLYINDAVDSGCIRVDDSGILADTTDVTLNNNCSPSTASGVVLISGAGNMLVGGTLDVKGATTTTGITNTGDVKTTTLTTTGNATVGGTLAVTGATTTKGITNTGTLNNTGKTTITNAGVALELATAGSQIKLNNGKITGMIDGTADTDSATVKQVNAVKTHFFSVNNSSPGAGNYNNGGAVGTDGVAVGVGAIAQGTRDVSIGYTAGQTSVTANVHADSINIGTKAGQEAQGNANVLLGKDAGIRVVGDQNTIIGDSAGDGFTGSLNTVIGNNAGDTSSGSNNNIIGSGAGTGRAAGDDNFIGGSSAGVGGDGSNNVYLGNAAGNGTFGDGNIAIGIKAGSGQATANATNIGTGAIASKDDGIAIGTNAQSLATGINVAIGKDAKANAETDGTGGAVSIGLANDAEGDGAVAIGDPNYARGTGSVTLGANNTATKDGTQTGTAAANGAAGQVAIGNANTAQGQGSVAIGNQSKAGAAGAAGSIAIGDAALAQVNKGVALGSGSSVTQDNGVALGTASVASTAAGKIGYDVITNTDSKDTTSTWVATHAAVSVGDGTSITRQITGVAAGTQDTDAVNVAQLKLLAGASATHYYSAKDSGTAGGNYNNDGALGANSIAAGVDASSTTGASEAIAIGKAATVTGQYDIAIGTDASKGSAATTGDIAIGTYAGQNMKATSAKFGTASGHNIAVGQSAGTDVGGDGNAAFGFNAGQNVNGKTNASVGYQVGQNIAGEGNSSIGSHSGSGITGDGNFSAGAYSGTTVEGDGNMAIGYYAGTTVKGSGNVAFGSFAGQNVTATSSVSIGTSSNAGKDNSVAIGTEANASVATGVALGSGSVASTASNGVGYKPNAVPADVAAIDATTVGKLAPVSVGSTTATRQIQNVAAGSLDSDVVNVAQLKALGNTPLTFTGNTGKVDRKLGETLAITGLATTAGTYSGDNLKTVVSGTEVQLQMTNQPKFGNTTINAGGTGKITGVTAGTDATDAVNFSQLASVTTEVAAGTNVTNVVKTTAADGHSIYTVNAKGTTASAGSTAVTVTAGKADANNVTDYAVDLSTTAKASLANADKGWNVTTAKTGSGVANGTTVDKVAPGETATFTAGNNIITTQVGKEVQVAVNPVLTAITSIAITNGATITDAGINMGGDKITNMAPGTASGDAVNVSQLTTVVNSLGGGSVINADGSVKAPTYTITKTDGSTYTAVNNVGDALTNLNAEVVKPITFTGNTGTSTRKLGETLAITGAGTTAGIYTGANLKTEVVGNEVKILMTDSPVFTKTTVGTVITNSTTNDIVGLSNTTLGDATTDFGTKGRAATEEQLKLVNATANAGWDVAATAVTGTTGKVVSDTGAKNVAPGATATWSAGNNIEITRVGTEVQIATSMTPVFTTVKADTVTVGPVVIDKTTGINAGDLAITNVKAGAASKDAVNVSQLTTVVNSLGGGATIDGTTGAVTAPTYTITKTDGSTYTAVNNVGDALTNLNAEVVKPITFTGNTGTSTRKLGETLAITGLATSAGTYTGNNLKTVVVGNDVQIQMAESPVFGATTINADGSGKITGLTAGTADTDAVNVSQLKDAINGSTYTGWGISAQGANASNVASGEAVDLNNKDGNIVVSKATDSDNVTFDLAKDIKVDSVTAGNTVMNTNGLTIAGGPSITTTGVDAGGLKVTNVAEGTISTISKDAVNGSQLFALGNSVASSLGGTSTYNPTTNAVTAGLTVGGTTYTTVQDALQSVNTTANAGWKVTTAATGTGTVSGTAVSQVATGSTATFTAGDNIAITQKGTEVQVAVNPNLVVTSVKAGDTTIDTEGLTIVGGPSVTKAGVDAAGTTITNVAAGVNDTDAVNVSQLNQMAENVNKGWSVTTAATGTGVVNGSSTTAIGSGGTATFAAGDNMVLTQSGTQVAMAVNPNLNVTSVTTGATKMSDTGVVITGGPSMTSTGIDAGSKVITNVAAGTADTDGVNVSQLKGLSSNIVNQANGYADNIGRKAYAGVAAAMAMGEAPWVPGKWTAYEGVGYYQGEVAGAVSLRRTAHNGRWSIIGGVSYSPSGGVGAKLGATQILDWGSDK